MYEADGPPTSKPNDKNMKSTNDGFVSTGIVSGFESNDKQANSHRGNDASVFSPVKPMAATYEVKKQETDSKDRSAVSRSPHIISSKVEG